MIGFLAPNGEFYKCSAWGHAEKAKELCRNKYKEDVELITDPEDYLLDIGFLMFKRNHAFMKFRLLLTKKQLSWLIESIEKINVCQKKDISKIMELQEYFRIRRFIKDNTNPSNEYAKIINEISFNN